MMIAIAIICALLSIIPAGTVYLVLHSKILDILRRYDALKRDDDIIQKISARTDELSRAHDDLLHKIENIHESFISLSNKIASRSRREDREEKEDHKEEKEEYEQTSFLQAVPGQGNGGRKQFVLKKY